jgi:uroporphyrinogen-III decarboxylase
MAGKIYPQGKLLMETATDPEKLAPLLRFCTDTIRIYAQAFASTGAGVVVFDSFVCPPMLSPQSYHDLILPLHREIMQGLEDQGILQRTLIIGGNTLPILPDVVSSGATQYLLDFNIPLEEVKSVLQEYPDKAFRVNLPPSAFGRHNHDELEHTLCKTLNSLGDFSNLIIGTGILPPDVPPANILKAKKQIQEFYN